MRVKFFLIILLICSLTINGQEKKELKVKDFFWGENDTHKNATEIPEKWKNESAVILYKNQNYDFHKYAKNVTYTTSSRKRIKLLDKSAVKEFSEFSFTDLFRPPSKVIVFPIPIAFKVKQHSGNFVGIKIIKPNGKEIEIDVSEESVQVDGKTKIAISNLEVGDIIDYYIYKEDPFKSKYAFGFDPVETTLSEDYPIVDFKLFFETENDFFINFNSFNGAPDLEEIPTEKNNFRRYSLIASNIDKFNINRWFYPLIEVPSYKFQVYFARSGKFENKALAFLPEKEDIIKKSVTKEEILDLYDTRFKPDGDIGDIKSFLKDKTFKNDREKVIAAYYYMRHYYLTRYIEAFYAYETGIYGYPFALYSSKSVFIESNKEFVKHFTEFLKKQKIDFEIVVAKNRYDGSIHDLLIEKNVNVLLKVNTKKPIYLEHFGAHTNAGQFSPLIEDSEVYLLTTSKNKIDGIKEGKLPKSSHEQNETLKTINTNLNDDFSAISMSSINSYKGHKKEDQYYDRFIFKDYLDEDFKTYETQSFSDRIKKKKLIEKYKNEYNALIEKLQEKQLESLKDGVKEEYGLASIEDYSFKINETGRYDIDAPLIFTEKFKIENELIKKAGPNYIFEIGKLIGEQFDLTEKIRNRTENVYMNYARSYNFVITFNIPEGYEVSGIDKLNKHVDNVTGAFISTAKIIDNALIINSSKQYKTNYEPNSNWGLMTEFLDAAFQFTNEKILLKPN